MRILFSSQNFYFALKKRTKLIKTQLLLKTNNSFFDTLVEITEKGRKLLRN